jgi:hypothetical protein
MVHDMVYVGDCSLCSSEWNAVCYWGGVFLGVN